MRRLSARSLTLVPSFPLEDLVLEASTLQAFLSPLVSPCDDAHRCEAVHMRVLHSSTYSSSSHT
jgi:hypothetical protein